MKTNRKNMKKRISNQAKFYSAISILFITILFLTFILSVNGADRDFEKEEKIGRKLAERIEKRYDLVEDIDNLKRIEKIGEHLKKISEIKEINYHFNIINQEGVNAFAFPGGFIYITSDLLDYVHSDDELAAIIAHEMGHVICQHSIKQMQDNRKMKLVELFAVLLTGDPAVGLIGELTTITVLNNYRREYEEEADLTALELLNKSPDYHPVALLTFFERVHSKDYFKPNINLGIFQTHPDIDYRIENIKKYLNDNNIKIERRLTTEYFNLEGIIRIKKDSIVSTIILNDKEILRFTGNDVEKINRKTTSIIEKLEETLRVDLNSYSITIYSGNDLSSLSIDGKVIVSLSKEEASLQGFEHSEVIENMKKTISSILWELKLQLPVLLFGD
ncbi:MAG: M48 family metalloprotease [Atribacterota bacterium]|nr:M48 family metalloprotease [Atribacterota bacterium]